MPASERKWLQQLGDAMDSAVSQRYLPDPGSDCSKFHNPNESDSAAYIKAVRARLIELGYLIDAKAARQSPETDIELIAAIKQFQHDTGIDNDGWAGPQTWSVLECLVSFENQQNPLHWHRHLDTTSEPLANPAVARAAYCRLYTLGFFGDWKRDKLTVENSPNLSENQHFKQALSRFSRFAVTLKLLHRTASTLDITLLCALFNHDNLVASLANSEIFAAAEIDFADNINAISRVELWMLGYDVTPGKDRFRWQSVRAHKQTARRRKKVSRTSLAIQKFCHDNSEDMPTSIDRKKASHQLLATFSTLANEPELDTIPTSDIDNSVGRILADSDSRKIFNRQFKTLANGVFDGIKRVVKWLARMLRKALSFSVDFIANIVRYIGKQAKRNYIAVVKAFDIVHASASYLKQSVHSYGQQAHIIFTHDRDFDQYCLIDPRVKAGQVGLQTSKHQAYSRVYRAGLVIVSHLVRMATRVVQVISSPAGWLLALLSLSKLAESVEAIREQIAVMEKYELDINHPQALFRAQIT